MQRILVGVDGSSAAGDALEWSADVARRGRLDLVAANVFSPTQAELPPEVATEQRTRQRRELDDRCARLDLDGSRAVVLDGDPAEALLDAAVDVGADLLVVGRRAGGPPVRLDPTSAAGQLVHTTTVPLAVVPHAGATPLTHLVVGVDGSVGSHAAVDVVTELASRLGVGVTAVLAFDPPVEFVPESDVHSWRHDAERAIHRWMAAAEKAGVDVEVDVDRDVHPAAAIARALDANPGSVACVGTGGLSDVTGLRLGRIPLQLVERARSAVIVVPARPNA